MVVASASHLLGSVLREAGCLMSRSREDRRVSNAGLSPRSARQHWSISEWRAGAQLCGAGRRYWSATAFITCRGEREEDIGSPGGLLCK